MRKNILLLSLCALLFGCEITPTFNGTQNLQTHSVAINSSYHSLKVTHSFDVYMSDTATAAWVTMDSALFDKLIFRISNSELTIGLKSGIYSNIGTATVVLPYNSNLGDLTISGASSFTSQLPLAANEIEVELSGSSSFNADIANDVVSSTSSVDIEVSGSSWFSSDIERANEIEIEISGSSSASVRGNANIMKMDVGGASNLQAEHLLSNRVSGSVSGSSEASVCCYSAIEVNVSGASSLYYRTQGSNCNPSTSIKTSGSSTATQR